MARLNDDEKNQCCQPVQERVGDTGTKQCVHGPDKQQGRNRNQNENDQREDQRGILCGHGQCLVMMYNTLFRVRCQVLSKDFREHRQSNQ